MGISSLTNRRHCRRLIQFYKIKNDYTPAYIKELIPTSRPSAYNLRSPNVFNEIKTISLSYNNSYFPDVVRSWNKLDDHLRNLPNLQSFKNNLNALFRPFPHSIYNISGNIALKWLYQLRVGLTVLNDHKWRHMFRDTPSNLCQNCNFVIG